VEKRVAILDVKALGWLRHFLRGVFHQILKHCSLVRFIEETVSCAKAVSDRGERLPHQHVKVNWIIKMLKLDE